MEDLKLSTRIAVIGLLIAASVWMQAPAAGAMTHVTGTATAKRSTKINLVVPTTSSFEQHERSLIDPLAARAAKKAKGGTQEPGKTNKHSLRKALEQKRFQGKEGTRALDTSKKDASKDLGQERGLVDDKDYAEAKTHPPMEPPRK